MSYLEEFFKTLCFFVKTDLISCFVKGRNIKVIYMFLISFYEISNSSLSDEKKDKAIKELKIVVNKYIEHSSQFSDHIEIPCIDISCIPQTFVLLKSNFVSINDYYNAIQFFNEVNKNKDDNDKIFRQGVIEGYNALVHLLRAVNGNNTDKNVLRASNHFYRGTLDFYKAIIRENFKRINIEEFKKLREEEYKSIGLDTKENQTKQNLLTEYKNLAFLSIKSK